MAGLLVPVICGHLAILYDVVDYELDQDDEDENPVLYRPFPLDASFDVRAFSTKYCKEHYLFTCVQLQEILEVLCIGPTFKSDEGDHDNSLTVLCMTIHRLAYPSRLNRMEAEFRRSSSSISRLVNDFITHIMSHWDQALTWDTRRLTRTKLGEYADLCYERSGRECNAIFGVIDCTVRKIQAPSIGQQGALNGHKHMHALKYQTVVAPDGIIIHISKGYPGTAHDYTIYEESGLIDILNEFAFDSNGNSLATYGDAAYEPDPHMIVGYRGHLEPDQEKFNQGCSNMRIIVEWAFGQVTKYSSGIDFPRLSTPAESYYRFAVLLTNIHTCYFGNKINMHFSTDPPTLHQYLGRNQ